jgi:uncharacterized protein (DUF779 family)
MAAKVEFANNSNYASATIIVEQTVTNWTDTDITINVVPGTLQNGSVYAFVTTANDAVNDVGYEVDFTLGVSDSLSSGSYTLSMGGIPEVTIEELGGSSLSYSGTSIEAGIVDGKVEFANNANYASATIIVSQAIKSWSDTEIVIDVIPGDLQTGKVYVFVTSPNEARNEVGYEIDFTLEEVIFTDTPTGSSLSISIQDIGTLHNITDIISPDSCSLSVLSVDVYRNYSDLLNQDSISLSNPGLSAIHNYADVQTGSELGLNVSQIDVLKVYSDSLGVAEYTNSVSNIDDVKNTVDILSSVSCSLTTEDIVTEYQQAGVFTDSLIGSSLSLSNGNISVLHNYSDALNYNDIALSGSNIDGYRYYSDILSPCSLSYSSGNIVVLHNYSDSMNPASCLLTGSDIDYVYYVANDILDSCGIDLSINTIDGLLDYRDVLLGNILGFDGSSILVNYSGLKDYVSVIRLSSQLSMSLNLMSRVFLEEKEE